jgi:hypothetical protein
LEAHSILAGERRMKHVAARAMAQPLVPFEHQLWNHEDIAAYLRRSSVRTVVDRLVKMPWFPKPIHIPNGSGGKSYPLYKAVEVVSAVEAYQVKAA